MRLPSNLTRHKAFIGNVGTMMSGKGIAAAIALLTMPIIARLFSPNDFGVAALFLSLGLMVSNVGALRYESALVLPRSETEALQLMAFSYCVLAIISAAMLILIGGYELGNLTIPVLESLGIWLWFLPIGILLLTLVQIQENWLVRTKAFNVIAASMVVGTIATGGGRIGLGFLAGSSVFGLVVGHMFGQICRLAVQKRASSEGVRATFQQMSWSDMRRLAVTYSDFPKLNAPAALLTAATQQLPIVLFGILFSPHVVGFYAMATRLSHAPIVIVANSVRRVFLQKAAEIVNRGRSLRLAFLLSTGVLMFLGVIPFALLFFYGQPLVTWLLGERWFQAGKYLEIVSPWLYIIWVTAPSNSVFIVLRRQRVWLSLQITTTLLRLSMFGFAYFLAASPEWTLGAFVTATVAGNVVIILATLVLIEQHASSLSQKEP